MNQLKKIIFINSLFPYQEIAIKGSVHFGGANGTGKTSVLGTIAGFYTGHFGDTPNDIRAHTHFFPNKNSWIIYEIEGSKGLFSVAVNRSLGSPSFYFINGDFEEELFRQKSKAKSAEKVLEGVKSRKLHFTGPIEEVDEYLSVLYGEYQGKDKSERRKYALATSESMGFIPTLLESTRLRKSLPFSRIKEILFKLEGHTAKPLDVEKVAQGLQEFRKDQRDLFAYAAAEKDGQRVVEDLDRLTQLESDEEALAQSLNQAASIHKKQEAYLKKEAETAQQALKDFYNFSEEKLQQKQAELKKLHYKAGELAYRISTAKQKEIGYEHRGIAESLKRFEELSYKRLRFASQLSLAAGDLKKEDILKREYLEASLLKEKELRLLQEDRVQHIQQQREQETVGRNNIASEKNLIKEIDARIRSNQESLDALYLKRSEIEGRPYFQAEIEQTQKDLYQQQEESLSYRLQLSVGENDLNSLQKRKDSELAALEKSLVDQEKTFVNTLSSMEKGFESLSSLIANSGRAFMGWLEKNYPNWQESIGKILKDEVLLSPFLNPGIERINELFYGIHLDLSDLPESELDVEALNRKKNELAKEIESYKKEQVKTRKKSEQQLVNREKYFRQKHREQKRKQQKIEYALQQLEVGMKKGEANIASYKKQGVQERSAQLLKLSYEEVALKEAIEKEEQAKQGIENRIGEQEQALAKSLSTQLAKWEKEEKSKLESIEKNWKNFEKDWQKRKKASAQKGKEVGEDFWDWESLQQMIFQYRADKREYLDQAAFWEREEAGVLSQIKNREADLYLSYEDRTRTQKSLQEKWEQAEEACMFWESTEKNWKQIQASHIFTRIKPFLKKEEGVSGSPPALSLLLQKLQFASEERDKCIQALEKSLRIFQSHFSADNSFGFSVSCKDLKEIKAEANTLKLFWEEGKLEDFKQAIHVKHAELILGISEESAALKLDTTGIEKRLKTLTEALESLPVSAVLAQSHFAIHPSAKNIFQILSQIQAFQEAHAQELGSSSLFNQGNKQSLNKEAYELLSSLHQALGQYPGNSLTYTDAFELSWQSKDENPRYGFSNYSPGLQRQIQCILVISLLQQLFESREEIPQIHILLDNLFEFDESALAHIQEISHQANIQLITAAPNPSSSINYDQVFQLKIKDTHNLLIEEIS